MEFIPLFFIIVVVLYLYFIPTMVASGRKHLTAIFILNLFLGWCLIGWIGALIWALCDDKEK